MLLDSYLYLTKNVSIVCHRCASNGDSAGDHSDGDENAAVADETDDSRAKGDDQEDDSNTMDAMEVVAAAVIVAAVENGWMTVGEVGAEDDGEDCDDDDENDEDDAKGGQDDEGKQEVSIVKLSSSMNSVMTIEAKWKQDDLPMKDQVCVYVCTSEGHSIVPFSRARQGKVQTFVYIASSNCCTRLGKV